MSDAARPRPFFGLAKYGVIFGSAVREQWTYLPSLFLGNVFYAIVLFIFSALWRVVGSTGTSLSFSVTQLVWYLALTEMIEFSRTGVTAAIQTEIRDGSVAYTLSRPFSYVGYHFARSFGESLVKLVPLAVVGFGASLLLAGPLPGFFMGLVRVLPLLVGGIALATFANILIGLCAFGIEETSPLRWIYQKLVFIVGGMFLPIDLFPEWMRGAARVLPFAYQAYWPARLFIADDPGMYLQAILIQWAYVAGFGVAAWLVLKAAERRLHVQGG